MRKWMLLALTMLLALCVTLPALADIDFMFDTSVVNMFEGENVTLTLLRQAGALDSDEIVFTSNAPRIASVDANGTVTALKMGKATISATLKAGKRTYKSSVTVNVQRAVTAIEVIEKDMRVFQPDDAYLEGLLGEMEDAEIADLPVLVLSMGKDQAIRATLLPKDASNRQFIVTSTDEEIVRVMNATNLRPVAPGECVITVSSKLNPEVCASYRVLVIQPVRNMTLDAAAKKIKIGGTTRVIPAFTPDNATICQVTWSSANPRVATVDENGVVTGLTKGSTTIKAMTVDGSGRYATIQIQVVQQPTSISLAEDRVSVPMGGYKQMRATVYPTNVNSREVTWTSSDERVAKVNSAGRVTPVAAGTCTITCASKDFPEVFVTAQVTVTQPVTQISFTQREVTVNVGSTVQVYWTTAPANATNPAVTLSSADTRVATVDANGVITGRKRGTVNIIATAQDGSNRKASIKVNVLQPVQGVHMKNDTVTVDVEQSLTLTAVLEPENASNTAMTWITTDPRIVTVRGKNTRPTVTGHAWGTATVVGTTEDGGYTTFATVNVGNYDKALAITDLYLQSERIKINVRNVSNMNITRFYFTIAVYDIYENPLPCTTTGNNVFDGVYAWQTLYEGESTVHGHYTFHGFQQPALPIGKVEMHLTGYCTDTGYVRNIRENRQPVAVFTSGAFVGPLPTDTPEPTEAPAEDNFGN